jgi:putative toxin-antitoxin system antitoxin component (TIGR02293 family)
MPSGKIRTIQWAQKRLRKVFDRRRASWRPRRASSPAPVGAGLGVSHSPGNFGGGGGYLDQGGRISRAELAAALGIPERTLTRRKREGMLSSEESAKLVRLARVVQRAEEVFEDLGATVDWLKSPNAAFSGQTPLSLLDTEIGAELVMDTLGRIEHGVFA